MSATENVNATLHFGTVELEQRQTVRGGAIGFESRTIHKDVDGIVVKIGAWQPPCCWLVFSEPEPGRNPSAPWWRFW